MDSPLWVACWKGPLEVVKALLARPEVDVNQAEKNGVTPLWIACRVGRLNIVNALLGKDGIEINQARKDGVTPLYVACAMDHLEVVKELLKYVTPLTRALYRSPSHDLPALYADGGEIRILLSRPRL